MPASTRDDLAALVKATKAAASPFRTYLNQLHQRFASVKDGKPADYIPELARANPDLFGISVVTTDGKTFNAGDTAQTFTIQSISKPFVYGLALEKHGRDFVNTKVGVEPTGDAFNSLIRLDEKSKRPHNPMINAGAIATAGLIHGADSTDRLKQMLEMFRKYINHEPQVDVSVFVSEKTTGHRNRAIGHLMLNFGMIDPNVDETLDLYFQQCSILVTSQDLAMIAATLANKGINPVSGERAIEARYVRDILSVMHTCGMYDYSGNWAYSVGLPAKSGVGGGIIAVVPGKLGIGIFSPPLDERGNSVRGIKVCQALVEDLGLHIFDCEAKASELMPV
ncbi:MAG TPA: glutaminase A [Tepidisphaeraceae bacterium]|jgi:glutaminase|nr:glutaminase A [Tepidisphaeraceae bacterium]